MVARVALGELKRLHSSLAVAGAGKGEVLPDLPPNGGSPGNCGMHVGVGGCCRTLVDSGGCSASNFSGFFLDPPFSSGMQPFGVGSGADVLLRAHIDHYLEGRPATRSSRTSLIFRPTPSAAVSLQPSTEDGPSTAPRCGTYGSAIGRTPSTPTSATATSTAASTRATGRWAARRKA